MNPMQLTNVSILIDIHTRFPITKSTTIREPISCISEVVWAAATANPQWKFVATFGSYTPADDSFRPEKFMVYQDKEQLGAIEVVWFRRKRCVGISNHRIRDKLSRGDMQRTTNTANALSIIKKTFVAKNTSERVNSAAEIARGTVKQSEWSISRKVRNSVDTLLDGMRTFVFQKHYEEFRKHLSTLPDAAKLLITADNYKTDSLNMATIKGVKEAMDNNNTCTVVLIDGRYIVKYKDDIVNIYDDNTFPDDLKGRLGLLKLVMEEQMISDIGCRVNEEVFVIML